MPYVFFKNAGNIFQLLLDSGPDHWDKQTLLDIVGKCGYSILNVVNGTFKEEMSGFFCDKEKENPLMRSKGYETLKLAFNNSYTSVWQCVTEQASQQKCDSGEVDPIMVITSIMLGLMGLTLLMLCCTASLKFYNNLRDQCQNGRRARARSRMNAILRAEEARALVERRAQRSRRTHYGTGRGSAPPPRPPAYASLDGRRAERTRATAELTVPGDEAAPPHYTRDVVA